ncbi:MAG: tryptophan--tRNA ligase [Chlamydiae bacterium]|nr:tryptophan--tRNA ligase [Chlamydiota bacterium]MBI3277761.1 tryptophan--tRNA ligase [Chlamydiota bacterium]
MERVLSGTRPTDRLHLGNFLGAIENWKKLESQIGTRFDECFFMIADWHALTTEYEHPEHLRENIRQVAIDYISSGLNPEKSTLFIQSHVKEHAELHLLLSMLTPLAWLERNPTYKEQLQEMKEKDLKTYGFLGYPILQTSDILAYRATTVPVGMDQLPHLELSREMVRRFNFIYRKKVFPEPQSVLTEIPKLLGIDGRKMSKSYGNAIYLSDSQPVLKKKIMSTLTDPARKLRTDKGTPEVCTVYSYHQIYSKPELDTIAHECREALRGCTDCKMNLFKNMAPTLQPIHEKRLQLETEPKKLDEILKKGTEKARSFAERTLKEVREVMGL